jgi:outer membrane protein OmpA-like peptidoglycan-associated protein
MLGDLELQLVQRVDTEQEQILTQHEVPALEGDFLQRQGRRASRLTLEGIITGDDAADRLKTLREKFRAAAPVTFVADIATATQVGEVLIEELSVRELAGKPARFAYALTLREFLPPPRPQTEEPPPIITPTIDVLKGTLVIDVVAEGDVDLTNVQVTLESTNADGTSSTRVVTQRAGNTWTATDLEPGNYTAKAATLDADPATATGSKQVNAGQTSQLTLTLRRGAPVATMFVVHFRFDRAFVEPCARNVLRQVRDFAAANLDQKLVIVGHTDRTGSGPYNQSLSERRARAVHAFLTFGRDQAAADASVAEWNELRRRRRPPNALPTISDNWETELRQAQHMLQDLGDYPGNVDNQDGPLTREAIRAFRCRKGLPPGTTLDDDVWEALVRDYMAQDSFAVPASQFLPNCPGEVLKWLGCGEEDPVNNTQSAFRPSRRVELLFVRANSLPCQVPQPDTFNLPQAGAVNGGWCVGPAAPATSGHGCFVTPRLIPGTNNPQPCSTSPTGPWCRQPAEPGAITVQGNISFENGTPAAAQPFVLIAPNGEFVTGELGNGEPNTGRATDASGNFNFPDKPKGFYHLEVHSRPNQPALLVRLAENGDETVRGNSVCKALRADTDRLNAVIIDAPTLREIRIPTAAHLMTALHPTTRAVRTCPASGGGPALPQRTAHTVADARGFFDAANRVWRQARVRLVLQDADIVSEAYALRTDCEVDGNEFVFILERCAYPNTANFFFFGDLTGASEAGFTAQSPIAGPRVSVEGCAVSDRFLFTALTPPLDVPLNTAQSEQVTAHEFGHFLSLAPANNHVANTPANSNRLMLAGTLDGSNRTLVQTEVAQARASNNAGLDCLPLSLNVTGATRIGGARSHEFMVFQDTTGAGVVTVDAVINPKLLDPTVGSVAVVGGLPGANPLQRTVSTATTGSTEIVATYTPARGGSPVITYASVFVVTFALDVDGARRVAPGSNTFVVARSATGTATVRAVIDPAPFCVPTNLVTWAGGDQLPDPLRRSVPLVNSGPVTISATLLGRTESVQLVVVEVTLADVRLIGRGQNTDLQVTLNPSPLPAGATVTLQLRTTTGTGEARFQPANSVQTTLTQTGTVAVRGITESSVNDNVRLEARITGLPDVVTQRDLTVIAVAIGSVAGVKVGETLDIPITVTPSPLPAGTSLTLELTTATGTGAARFTSTNATTMTITQTGNVTVRGETASSVPDNIRLRVRITGQTAVLAEEAFSVLNPINFFVQFEVWNLNTRRFETLPAGVPVDVMDEDVVSDDLMATGQTDAQGRVTFSLPSLRTGSGEDAPDIYFRVRTNGRFHAGHVLPAEWKTKGWRATDGSPGLFNDFTGNQIGSAAAPLVYRIGLDFHLRLTYLDLSKFPSVTALAPLASHISVFRFRTGFPENRLRTFPTDTRGEVHGVIFNIEGGDNVIFTVEFEIDDPAINMRLASVDIDKWDTNFNNNSQTSIGTDAAPLLLNANSNDRNVALYFLKCLRELSTFLFHMTGGAWTGFNELTFFRTSISGTPYSWPVGSVNISNHTSPDMSHLPPPQNIYHWDRGTIIHEITHQTMWKELDISSAGIAVEAIFGGLLLTHDIPLRANPTHALIEGWAELFEAIFAHTNRPPYAVPPVFSDIKRKHPVAVAPGSNIGESVEGMFANGMMSVFENHVVTNAVFTAAGMFNANVPESDMGDITTTTPWVTNPDVRRRFLSMIWNPFKDLRTRDQTTTQLIERIRARNPVEFPAIQADLQAPNSNMAFP